VPFDPTDVNDLARLRRCIREQRLEFRPYYDNRKVLLDALHDPNHSTDEIDTLDRRPHNPLDKFVRIVTRGVVDQNPTLRIVRSRHPRVAGMLREQLDRWAVRIGMANVLQNVFQEALLRWGICYTGYETSESDYGMEPFVSVLDFDDYFIDTQGHEENDIDYEGHVWARRLDAIVAAASSDPSYNQNVVDRLSQQRQSRFREKRTTLYDWVDQTCVWLPQENVELTLAGDDRQDLAEPLRIRRYVGPPAGPYLRLSLGGVRGCMVPVSRMGMPSASSEPSARASACAHSTDR